MLSMRWRLRAARMMLAVIPVLATVAAFGVLDVGRRLVEVEGMRAVRRTLVRESDQIASRTLREIERQEGCRSVVDRPLSYRRCVAMATRGEDSVCVSISVEPLNQLIAADTMRYVVTRDAR